MNQPPRINIRLSDLVAALSGFSTGLGIWLASEQATGGREPWDADGWYLMAMAGAGAGCGMVSAWPFPRSVALCYLWHLAGQAVGFSLLLSEVGGSPFLLVGVFFLVVLSSAFAIPLLVVAGVLNAVLWIASWWKRRTVKEPLEEQSP